MRACAKTQISCKASPTLALQGLLFSLLGRCFRRFAPKARLVDSALFLLLFLVFSHPFSSPLLSSSSLPLRAQFPSSLVSIPCNARNPCSGPPGAARVFTSLCSLHRLLGLAPSELGTSHSFASLLRCASNNNNNNLHPAPPSASSALFEISPLHSDFASSSKGDGPQRNRLLEKTNCDDRAIRKKRQTRDSNQRRRHRFPCSSCRPKPAYNHATA